MSCKLRKWPCFLKTGSNKSACDSACHSPNLTKSELHLCYISANVLIVFVQPSTVAVPRNYNILCIFLTNNKSRLRSLFVPSVNRAALWDFCPCITQDPNGFRLNLISNKHTAPHVCSTSEFAQITFIF